MSCASQGASFSSPPELHSNYPQNTLPRETRGWESRGFHITPAFLQETMPQHPTFLQETGPHLPGLCLQIPVLQETEIQTIPLPNTWTITLSTARGSPSTGTSPKLPKSSDILALLSSCYHCQQYLSSPFFFFVRILNLLKST